MDLHERLSPHFTMGEFIASETATRRGIDNTPGPQIEATLRNVLAPAMETVRALVGAPILVSSGYRSAELNAAIGGAAGSDHLTGHACDFTAPGYGTPLQVCKLLVQHMGLLRFDQLIQEGTWVHISFAPRRRNQVLTAHFSGGRVTYTQGL